MRRRRERDRGIKLNESQGESGEVVYRPSINSYMVVLPMGLLANGINI